MEFNQIVELIKAVSDSNVTSFKLEEGDSVISIKTGENNQPQIVQMQAPIMPAMQTPVVPTQVVASEMVATQPKAVVESVETATVTNKNIN